MHNNNNKPFSCSKYTVKHAFTGLIILAQFVLKLSEPKHCYLNVVYKLRINKMKIKGHLYCLTSWICVCQLLKLVYFLESNTWRFDWNKQSHFSSLNSFVCHWCKRSLRWPLFPMSWLKRGHYFSLLISVLITVCFSVCVCAWALLSGFIKVYKVYCRTRQK